jgi:UDP-N-acetylglucosamine/UDP-N-acetylgalactosamine diphosphorylase
MDFIKSVGQQKDLQPLHKAFKATPYLDSNGNVVTPKEPNAWKFERFIFDVLPHATKICVLVYPRELCFAPLKNASGPYSPDTVGAALMERDRTVLQEISGIKIEGAVEISQDFYYPTDALLEKWKGKAPQAGYIES